LTATHAAELIAEAVLAWEIGAGSEDLSLTVDAHPALAETLAFSAKMIEGAITVFLLKNNEIILQQKFRY
jgi:dihydrolipoamide dehydrogenase